MAQGLIDYISKEKAVKTAWMILDGLGYAFDENPDLKKTVSAVFETAPSADVRPVIRGEWIGCNRGAGYKCSVCKARHSRADVFNGNHNFCYKCGADMRRDEESK